MLVNYHCHSTLSEDARDTMPDMARAAQAAGLDILCFTDHCDLLSLEGQLQDVCDWAAADAAFAEAAAAAPGLELRLGIELGCPTQHPALAARMLDHPGLDFVIGSVHNRRAGPDYYLGNYADEAACRRELDAYLEQLLEVARSPFYDVLGHLDYPVRYMRRDGTDIDLPPTHPLVGEIFRAVIDSGRGIECNTSGYRNGGRYTMPSRALLAAYRDAGGTRLTIGTDAHGVEQVDLGLRESMTMLRELGFRELTIYRRRQPEQIPLEVSQ